MSVGTNIQTINFNKPVQQNAQMTFKSQTVPVKDYPPDTVEINGKKKTGTSKSTKWLISLGTLAALGIGARFGYKKILNNIYTKKLKITDFPEKIIF